MCLRCGLCSLPFLFEESICDDTDEAVHQDECHDEEEKIVIHRAHVLIDALECLDFYMPKQHPNL